MPKLARTNAEAHLFMDLHPCACGERRFARQSAVVTLDGDLASRYTGACARCGTERRFEFRIPQEILPPPVSGVRFGGPDPSELFDPGEWLSIADDHAARVPVGAKLEGDARRTARHDLDVAVAAIDEILKFAPRGAAEVPMSAFFTPLGRAIWDKEPGRFRRARLEAVRKAYADAAEKL
ncbi:MAG TPA: hypothetical protein VNO30_37560 [Kofleriaceae bacterium]|nr:hypothetical protein [Kofleriaceae bacterium]